MEEDLRKKGNVVERERLESEETKFTFQNPDKVSSLGVTPGGANGRGALRRGCHRRSRAVLLALGERHRYFRMYPSASIRAGRTIKQAALPRPFSKLSCNSPQLVFRRHISDQKSTSTLSDTAKKEEKPPGKKKTVAELDDELREKLEGRSGGGDIAGLELEDGKPVAMKRSVRENMFRLI